MSETSNVISHDLRFRQEDAEQDLFFRIIEVRALDIARIHEAISEAETDHAWVASILLVSETFDDEQRCELPMNVPWIERFGPVEEQFALLGKVLVDPFLRKGWPCIDPIDYAFAFRRGGRLRIFSASGVGLNRTVWGLRKALRGSEKAYGALIATRCPEGVNALDAMSAFCRVAQRRLDMGDDAFEAPSVVWIPGRRHEVIVMAVG